MKFADGFVNLMKGWGGSKDPQEQSSYSISTRYSTYYNILEDLYSTNWIAKKTVDIPVDDAMREGREIDLEEKQLKEFKEAYKYIDKQISKGLKFSRIYGGCALVAVCNDDDMMNELKDIRQGDLKNVAVLDRRQLIPQNLDRNPLSKTYLKPESFIIANTSTQIHPSRIFYIDGEDTTYYDREQQNGFGLSVFEKMYKEIENATFTNKAIRAMVEQANIDVLKLEDLKDTVSTSEGEKAVQRRLEVTAQMKGLLNQLAIDKNDDYVNIAKNFGTLDKIQMNMFQLVCAPADIPYTRFMGKSADGQNATGEGDMRNYYDMVKSSIQVNRLEEIYKWLDPIVNQHLFGKREPVEYEFNPLYQSTPKEIADINNVNAQMHSAYLDRGVVSEEAVLEELKKDGLYKDYEYGLV